MAGMLGQFTGALAATFVISRLLLWIMRSWRVGVVRYLTVHVLALAVASLLGGMGMADEGSFAPATAATVYMLPQLVWLVVDLARTSSNVRKSEAPSVSVASRGRDTELTRTERVFWESIKDSTDPRDFEAYINEFPQGAFVAIARNRLMSKVAAPPEAPVNVAGKRTSEGDGAAVPHK
jgi:hypothetical protein